MEMMTDMLKKKVAMILMPLPRVNEEEHRIGRFENLNRETKMEKKVTFTESSNLNTNARSSAMSVGSEGNAEARSLSAMSLGSEGNVGSAMSEIRSFTIFMKGAGSNIIEEGRIPFSNDCLNISLMARNLSILGVPREEQPTILDKLFEVVQVSRPEWRIVVLIAKVVVRLLGGFHDLNTVERVIREDLDINVTIRFGDDDGDPSETYQFCGLDYHGVYDTVLQESFEALTFSFTPATRSSIESLPKVRLDSLEQATMEHISTCSM
ncbi:hypothetical protein ACLB2K_053969 [Fragaria x ananassa]